MSHNSFAGTPPTVSELKAAKTGKGSDWTPRDVLVAALRDYDEGKMGEVDTITVIWRQKSDEPGEVWIPMFLQRSPDMHTLWGVIASTLNRMMSLAGKPE